MFIGFVLACTSGSSDSSSSSSTVTTDQETEESSSSSSNSSSSTVTADQETEEYSIEYKLAVINAGGFVEEDDETVKEFKRLLDKIEKKVINSRQDIADIAVKAQEVLGDDGYNIELIQIMRDLNTAIPEGLEGIKLEEIAAAYMVLIEEQ